MLTDNPAQTANSSWRRYLPGLNLGLTAALVIAGLWYLSTRVSLAALGEALLGASPGWVLLALLIMLATNLLKGWRWQLMFALERPPVTFSAAFWATALGQYVNLVVPFMRLGEVARLYALNQEAHIMPGTAFGTLVVEKTLDLIFFGLTVVFVLPFVILPDSIEQPGPYLMLLPLILMAILYLLAFRTDTVIALWRRVVAPLPERPRAFLLRVAVSGLEGLAALRSRRLSLLMLLISLAIALLAVALPYALFPALRLRLNLLDAALIHIVVTIAIIPPSTPTKIGVLNGAAALTLWQLGVRDETAVASYSILFYLLIVVPQVVLGLIAASRSKWRWRTVLPAAAPANNQTP